MARQQRNIKKWAGIVERWKLSGMSSKEFCMQEGFSEGRFYEVRKQLETGIDRHANKTKKKKISISPQPLFLPVRVQPQQNISPSKQDSFWMEITLSSGHCLRFPSTVNTQTLNKVVNALTGQQC
jgi:hypothetical protein